LIKIRTNIQRLKKKDTEIGQQVSEIINQKTKKEKDNLDKAYKLYNDKLNKILNSSEIQQKIEEKEECQDKITDLLYTVKNSFRKAVRAIKKQDISENEKHKKITELGAAIQDAILSKDEKKIIETLKRQFNNMNSSRTNSKDILRIL